MKYKNIKAVLFDLDGTLVCTGAGYRYKLLNKVLNYFQTSTDIKTIDKFWFGTIRSDIVREDFGLEAELFWDKFNEVDTPILRKEYTRPYEDVKVLKELREIGFKIGLVTTAPPNMMKMEVGLIGEYYFDSMVSANSHTGIKVKPSPEGIIMCLNELEVDTVNSVYVGNGEEDIRAAFNAKIPSILIQREENELVNTKPDTEIASLYELNNILAKDL